MAPAPPPELLGRGQRQRTQSVTLKDYVVGTVKRKTQEECGLVSAYPLENYVNCDRFQNLIVLILSPSPLKSNLNLLKQMYKMSDGKTQWVAKSLHSKRTIPGL